MKSVDGLSEEELTRSLAYAGFVLVAYELTKSLIVGPIKFFYKDMTFGPGMPFTSYDQDVLFRHRNEFEACLLYLRDFMEAIDSEDALAIQALRKHRNDIAHDVVGRLVQMNFSANREMLEAAGRALFKLSNHQAYIELGHDPALKERRVDWDTLAGAEYLLFEQVLEKVRRLDRNSA